MQFNKKTRFGNFYLLKFLKGGLPIIKVSTITDTWSVEYTPAMSVFKVLDDAKEDEYNGLTAFRGHVPISPICIGSNVKR